MNAFENSKPLSKIIYLFVFSLAGLFLAGSLVTIVSGFWDGELMLSPWGLRISSGMQMGFMFFMPAITLVTWSGDKPIAYLALNRSSNSFALYPIAFAILLFGMPFITLLSQINQLLVLPDWLEGLELWMRNLEESAQVTTNLLLKGTSIWDYLGNILFVGVFAAVAEEVFFRGVLQQLLNKLFRNKHVGVWIGAFIFSLMHMQFYGFFPRIVLGAMLGYLFLYSKNLWVPIFVHFMNNAMVVTFNFFFK
ncbi:MAG: CPBP family intramembrane metalloprotease, partial [Bacteroidales bacterium]|nr:CPBP family intramembrane metalloprotease [Bacteroidales bacterium]